MTILFLFPHLIQPGGASNTLFKMARGLTERGFTVKILCANASEKIQIENSDLVIEELKIPNSNSMLYWIFFLFWQIKINHEIKKTTGAILIPSVLPSNWWAWLYAITNKKVNIIWCCHEPSAFIHSSEWINAIPNIVVRTSAKLVRPIFRALDLYLERRSNTVFCNSEFCKTLYQKTYKRDASAVIYPFIDIKQHTPINLKKEYFFTVSRLSKFKNIDRLIIAFKDITLNHPNFKLIIAGKGEEKGNLMRLSKALNLEDKIEFTGIVDDQTLRELYENALATIICSEYEPFGLVPVESMMYSTPVISHNSGGPMETVLPDKTGYLYNDMPMLIKNMNSIIEISKSSYQKMQLECALQASKFDSLHSLEKLIDLIIKTSKV